MIELINKMHGTTGRQPSFDLGIASDFTAGNFFGQATAIFKLFENENLGEVIASTNIVARNGRPGKIQVGQDVSIKQKDFAGNVIENFFETGAIINVTPHILYEEGINYILLNVIVERSTYVPDVATTIINKTQANTEVILLDGEEIVIGGLFINDEVNIRSGVPILKDLPWYVFGLRYIFGSEEIRLVKKELVILLKADLIPTLKERLASERSTNPLRDELLKQREGLKSHQVNKKETDGE